MFESGLISAFLADDVHLAWIDDDIVALDVEADAYACLVDAAGHIRPGDRPGAVRVTADASEILKRAGWLSSALSSPRRPLVRVRAEAARTAVPCRSIATALPHALWSTSAFRNRPLSALVAAARARRPAGAPADPVRAAVRATAFEAMRPWIPFEGDCLQRAWMLHHHLCVSGLDADWVFGVRTWPFLAHCWVQVGETVVGDSLDRVRGFTPILAA